MSKSVLHCLLTPTIDSDTGKKQTKQNKKMNALYIHMAPLKILSKECWE